MIVKTCKDLSVHCIKALKSFRTFIMSHVCCKLDFISRWTIFDTKLIKSYKILLNLEARFNLLHVFCLPCVDAMVYMYELLNCIVKSLGKTFFILLFARLK